MATLKFKHEDKNYTVKGEWDKNTFTAQAFAGKKIASAPFSIIKEKVKKGQMADDSALEDAVLEAAKNEVVSGQYEPETA